MQRTAPKPKTALLAAAVWVVICIVWLDISFARIIDMRAAGKAVSGLTYAKAVFWVGLLVFWCWHGWQAWGRLRADRLNSPD